MAVFSKDKTYVKLDPQSKTMKAVESTTAGHPDKVCDQIADAIVDEYIRRDPNARVDIKVLGSHGMVMIGGEVHSSADFDCALLAKQVYNEIGYEDEIEVFVNIEHPSEEMMLAHGAADTVVVNGYATKETREYLPKPVVYAHEITRRMDDLRKTDPGFRWIGPDGKVQIIMDKDRVASVTVLAQHTQEVMPRDVQAHLLDRVITPIIKEESAKIFINPLGKFVTAGFYADTGMSGRKSNVDFYGGLIPHGDNSLSGKDPSKVERAGAYMARYVAKSLVAQELADAVMVSLAYTLGRPDPIMIDVRAIGAKTKQDFTKLVKETYDFDQDCMVEFLKLKQPLYKAASVYGHFGREGFPWEDIG